MHAWEAVQKTLDYIEEHIHEDIEIEELATIAALSLFYYQRLFTRLVKKPVREYIKLRRLARACAMLRERENRIVDVAAEYGFSGHEVFTRAFKSTYGLTPAAYRAAPVDLDHFDKPDLLLSHVVQGEGVPLISDGLVLEMARMTPAAPISFLGVEGQFPFTPGPMLGERPGIDPSAQIWQRFFTQLPSIPALPGGRHTGICYHGNAPDGYTCYFAGAEVTPGTQAGRFRHWQLPVREYVVCSFEAENAAELTGAAVGKAMRYTRFWLREHGLRADGFFPEVYYPGRPGAPYMELWTPFVYR